MQGSVSSQNNFCRISGSRVQGAVILKTSFQDSNHSQRGEPVGQDFSLAKGSLFIHVWVQGMFRIQLHSSQLRLFPAVLSSSCFLIMSSHSSRSPKPVLGACNLREPSYPGIFRSDIASVNFFKG